MNERGGLEFLQFTTYRQTFLVEILIETIPTCHFFVPKQNSGWKRFKIDPKVGTSFPYIKLARAPLDKKFWRKCEGN